MQAMTELVMAWATDCDTGEPVWVIELGPERRGNNCRCICISCGLPLQAVNAAKAAEKCQKRPHFRHPVGAERSQCSILAARAAVLRQLRDEGWIDLPRYLRSGMAKGLSGQPYEVWVEAPAERVGLLGVHYEDSTNALLILADGRRLRVSLTGSASAANRDGEIVPTIFLDVNDPAVACMGPDELRSRLTLLPSNMCWQGHWRELELQAEADASALAEATRYLDTVPDGLDVPADLDPALRRQTVLHYEVMRILQESGSLQVPEFVADVWAHSGYARWVSQAQRMQLSGAQLERRLGRTVPDVTCRAEGADGEVMEPLVIEVTVTNRIDAEREQRIREAGAASLEIDLSRTGGRIDREGLRSLVVNELVGKRWIHRPRAELERAKLKAALLERAQEAQARTIEEERRRADEQVRRDAILSMPLSKLVIQYIEANLELQDAYRACDVERPREADRRRERQCELAVGNAAEMLAVHGYPEAFADQLVGPKGIIARLLSIQLDRGVGYRFETAFEVLNAIRQSRLENRSFHAVYILASQAYRPRLSDSQTQWFKHWCAEVRTSIKANEATYRRDARYDRLLALLFPELTDGLAKASLKRPEVIADHRRSRGSARGWPSRVDHLDTSVWLRGRALEEWRRRYPERARDFFGC